MAVALRGRDGGATAELGDNVQNCLRASSSGGDKPHVLAPVITMAHGQGGAEIGFDRGPTLTCNHEAPIAAYAVRTANTSANGHGISAECAHTLDQAQGQAVAFAIQAGALRTNPASGPDGLGVQSDHAYTLEAQAEVQAVAHPAHCREVAQTITSNYGKQVDSSDTALGPNVVMQSIATHEIAGTMMSYAKSGGDSNRIDNAAGGYMALVPPAMQVRRLTPVECERLQGFPDGYSMIPWRKKPASECPDGPRYKALGNSWAVPVVRWIGRRIDAALRALEAEREAA